MHNQESQRRRLNLSACLGGLGLLGCVACCTLPILGVIGIGGGAAAFFKIRAAVGRIVRSRRGGGGGG